MRREASGLLSELVLVRMHGRSDAYLAATPAERDAIVAACRDEATVADLAEKILSRTIYAQASSRAAPLRELLQNALDASPMGARIDVRGTGTGTEAGAGAGGADSVVTLVVTDRGRGMSRTELLEDLLVPFRSGKDDEPEAIGEHGIGFLSALEIAPWIEIATACAGSGHRLSIRPIGEHAPYADFAWSLVPWDVAPQGATGTTVKLTLAQPIPRAVLAAEITRAAGFVNVAHARIFVDDVHMNTARSALREVARVGIGERSAFGQLALFTGRGEGVRPELTITQRGLLVAARPDAFAGAELALHREIARAILFAGFGLVIDLPLSVPLTKGRSAVAAEAARAVDQAVVVAFERFVLEDALYDRELLRGVDHRLSAVLDRLLNAAMVGDVPAPAAPRERTDGAASDRVPISGSVASSSSSSSPGSVAAGPSAVDLAAPEAPKTPTVAAPEEVVRFAGALLDAKMIATTRIDPTRGEVREVITLRAAVEAYRAGLLRPAGESRMSRILYLALEDPLGQALWRRLDASVPALVVQSAERPRVGGSPLSMQRVPREKLLTAVKIPGVRALAAALTVLERIDATIAAAVGIEPSPMFVHQDLYGPDEMAHTDGAGISVNLASPRVRALLIAVLAGDDTIAFGALVDLVLHEKAHVSLASYVPRSAAEHGASFYRRKEWLRRRLLEAVASGAVTDPIRVLAVARRGLPSAALPAPEVLASAFSPLAAAA